MQEMTTAALQKVQTGKPTTFGGVIKNPALLEKVFLTQTVPDVQPRTRILAICGVTDYDNEAAPDDDGW